MIATNDSVSIPPKPISRMCDSRSTIFGVVPDEMSEWNPDTAPHAIVMNRNGNSGPENTGPGAVDEARGCRHRERRGDDVNADRQCDNRADLEERAQVVARCEHQPDRKAGRDGAVEDDRPRELGALPREHRPPRRALRHGLPDEDRGEQQDDAEDRRFADAPRTDDAHVDAHRQRDGDRRRDGEKTPRAVRQRLDDDQREHGKDDDHDRQNANQRERSGNRSQLHLDHLAQRLAVAPHRGEEHDEVLHGAGDHDADENPHRSRQEAHLRGQHRSHQRPRAGDRGEVVTVEHPLVRRHVVHAVVVPLGRRLAAVVEHEHLLGDELAVEAVGDEIRRERGGHQPDGVDVLAAVERQRSERECTDDGDAAPDEDGRELVHGASDFLFGTRRFPLAGGQPASHRRGAQRTGAALHRVEPAVRYATLPL